MSENTKYRKIRKICPGAYFFKGPFWGTYFWRRGLFTEGNLRFKIDWANLIVGNLPFLFCFTLYLRATYKYKPSRGPIFGGAYLQREICVSELYSWKEIYRFCFVLLCIWGQFSSTSHRGAYIWRGGSTEGFFCVTGLGGLYLEGLIFGILRQLVGTS